MLLLMPSYSLALFCPVVLSALLALAGCCSAPTEPAPAIPAAATSPAPTPAVKTYMCRTCGAVTSKPNRLGRCPTQKDGAPCRWKEIPRTN